MAIDVETAPPPAEPAPGRAGRNLPAAIGVGVGLGALVLVTLFTSRPAFLAIIVVAILVGLWELVRALHAGGHAAPFLPLAIGTTALIVLAYVYGRDDMVIAALLTAVAVVVWQLAEGPQRLLPNIATGMFALLYVGIMAGFAALMLSAGQGQDRMAAFVATVVASDVGGYTAGVLRGRHPMAPSISPKKTWEGLSGSVVLCAFGVTIATSATVGDLGESMIKRDLGIKDMGHLLPGHGGLMDRLDSLLPSAPVAWGLLVLFVGGH